MIFTQEYVREQLGYKCLCGSDLKSKNAYHLGGKRAQGDFLFIGCVEGDKSCIEGPDCRTIAGAISAYKKLRR